MQSQCRDRRAPAALSWAAIGLVACLLVALPACGSDAHKPGTPLHGQTIRVPQDASTIQGAVDKAQPGDLILVAPGTYHETVTLGVADVVIRGLSRARVVLDGRKSLSNGIEVTANGDAIENLTVENYQVNGIIFSGSRAYGAAPGAAETPLVGYRASYITAVDNGLYGIYAFASRDGLIEQSYASGSPDSGIYIGQCKPCDAVVRNTTAAYNAVGYEGTNAGGGLYVIDSTWRDNRVGMTTNSEDQEKLAPQDDAVLAGNLVTDNDALNAPQTAEGGFGTGIAIGGGTHNVIERNLVTGETVAGIVVTDLDEYTPLDNQVLGNKLSGNGIDLVYAWQGSATQAAGNCFAGNSFSSSRPNDIEHVLPCQGTGRTTDLGHITFEGQPGPGSTPIPPPPANLPDMPDAARAAAHPATDEPPAVNVDAIALPIP